MAPLSREQKINAAFVAVADTLTADYDIIDLMHTLIEVCTSLLDVQAGGLLLADDDGNLQLLASTSEAADFVEVMQLGAGIGPCVDCFKSGVAVAVADIAQSGGKWPEFQTAALGQGFKAVYATPMRLRGQVLGTMNLFSVNPGVLNEADAGVAQALADVATIGILQERSIRETG
ncbi:MAG: GAF domain-containing protein, partial [Pseudolysinimonas sp.]